jgi:hypothetical protein
MTDNFDHNDAERPEPRRRSIRQIPIPENRRVRRTAAPQSVRTVEPSYEPVSEPEYEEEQIERREERPARVRDGHFSRIGRRRSPLKWIVIAIIVIVGGAFGSTLFSSAHVTVSAKRASTTAPTEFTLENAVDYAVVSTTIVERETVAATAEQDVERKASGTITVYNDFGTEPQELIATTRFQTSDGLIFRIPQGITVPGNTVQGDKTIPGKIETQVVADEAGSEYNIGASKFTIPGFQGTPRFTAFSGESTTPMTGGFVGTVKTVSDDEAEAAEARLRSKIEARIQSELATAAGQGSIILSVPPKVTFSEAKITENGESATIEVTATVVGYAVSESVLAAKVAASSGAVVPQGTPLRFATPPAITATLDGQAIKTSVGQTEVVWVLDENAIRDALLGKKKAEVVTIATGFPGIETIQADFSPSWTSTFPAKAEKLTVSIE